MWELCLTSSTCHQAFLEMEVDNYLIHTYLASILQQYFEFREEETLVGWWALANAWALFKGPLLSTLFRKKEKKSLGLPDKFLSGEEMAEVEDGCEKGIWQILFSLFPKLKCPGEKEGYLYMEKLL